MMNATAIRFGQGQHYRVLIAQKDTLPSRAMEGISYIEGPIRQVIAEAGDTVEFIRCNSAEECMQKAAEQKVDLGIIRKFYPDYNERLTAAAFIKAASQTAFGTMPKVLMLTDTYQPNAKLLTDGTVVSHDFSNSGEQEQVRQLVRSALNLSA